MVDPMSTTRTQNQEHAMTDQTVRASAIAQTDRTVELVVFETDFSAERYVPDSVYVLTVHDARRLYNSLQDAINVIDARSYDVSS